MFFAITSYLNGIASIIAAIFVYSKKRDTHLGKLFCGLTLSIAWYSILLANVVLSPTEYQAVLWAKIEHVGVALIPAVSLHFCLAVIQLDKRAKVFLSLAYFFSIFLILTLPTGWFENGVREIAGLKHYIRPGPLYFAYFLFYGLCFVCAEVALLRAFLSQKRSRLGRQALFVFWASFLGSGAGSVTFLPVFGFNVAPSLNCLVILYVISLAYAILIHGLLDIEVIIKKTLVFAGLSMFAFGVFAFTTFLTQELLSPYVGKGRIIALVVSVVLIVLGYEPLRNLLVNLTDRYLFQKKVNYRLLLKEATEYLAHLDSLKKQARRIIAFLLKKARITNASIYAFQSHAPGSLLLQASKPPLRPLQVKPHKTIPLSHPIANYLRIRRNHIDLSQIEDANRQEKDLQKQEVLQAIIKLLKDHKSEAAIPCFGSDAAERARRTELHLRGILFLGHQKSDEPYTEEELDVFFTLGQESSIAFENARLYDEAVQRAQELQTINRELNDAQTKLLRALNDAQKSRQEAEQSREEALEAKKKTEEMELELIRREKLLFVEQLVKGLAHEIFNPMTSFRMETERLGNIFKEVRNYYRKTNSNASDELKELMTVQLDLYRHSVNLLERTTDHVFRVVDNLYQMQKPDDQTIKPVDFKSYWAIAVPLIEAQSHGEVLEQVPINSDGIQRNLPPVKGNGSQLTQVFLNLYRNALYAVKDQESKEIKIQADVDQEDNGYLKVVFEDNGTGIKPEVIPKIFDYMFTTKREKGQGIGLNMCKTIIERFGGTVICESEIGKGTKFIIRLPSVKEEAQGKAIQDLQEID